MSTTFFHALRSEAARSPKKAAVLGLLLLVAGWYWAPLVTGWFKPNAEAPIDESIVVEAVAAPLAPVAEPSLGENADGTSVARQTTPETPSSLPSSSDWQAIAKKLDGVRKARSANFSDGKLRLFEPESVEETQLAAAVADEAVTASIEEVERSPAELGFVLEGTLLLGQTASAVINGRTYREGDLVSLRSGAPGESVATSAPLEFRLEKIERKGIVLSRGAARYELSVKSSNLADGEQVAAAP